MILPSIGLFKSKNYVAYEETDQYTDDTEDNDRIYLTHRKSNEYIPVHAWEKAIIVACRAHINMG